MEIRLEQDVLTDATYRRHRERQRLREIPEEQRAGAGDRRDEELHLVDEVAGQERRSECRAALEQQRLDTLVAK